MISDKTKNSMTKLSLADMYDELLTSEKVLYDFQTQDLETFSRFVDHSQEVGTKLRQSRESESKKLEDAEAKIFQLEQKVRSLNIQLDEEREIKTDLEIENIKLKKRLQQLQTSLELVNNNCYDSTVEDIDKSLDTTEVSEADMTLCSNGGIQDFSAIKLLGEKTLDQNEFFSSSLLTAATPYLLPPMSTRKGDMRQPVSTVQPRPINGFQTYTKSSRRRSKSVDHHVGERTVIAPELCNLCEASKKSRRPEESPTLPWCPHNSYLANPSITLNVTPARSKSFLYKRSTFANGKNKVVTSTPAPAVSMKSILKKNLS